MAKAQIHREVLAMSWISNVWNDESALTSFSRVSTWITILVPFIFGSMLLILQSRLSHLQALHRRAVNDQIHDLEHKAGPRRISSDAAASLMLELAAAVPANVTIASPMMDGDGAEYGKSLASIFNQAGWHAVPIFCYLDSKEPGLHIARLDNTNDDRVQQLIDVLNRSGFRSVVSTIREGSGANRPYAAADEIVIGIGRKV
jgi:hypothetical protein